MKFSDYRALGLSVFPARGKRALVSWKPYQKEFAPDSQLEAWDKTQHNICVATGKLSGIVVVDVDTDDLDKSFPRTWTVKTAKGYHYYFKYPDGQELRNTVHINGLDVDIRAEGGYVVAPPSVHESGHIYKWIVSPDDCPLAELPAEWIKKEVPKQAAPAFIPTDDKPDDSYLHAALLDECRLVETAREGTRNHTLNEAAFKLATLIAHGLSESLICDNLLGAALSAGLSKAESEATIRSGIKAGLGQPRDYRPRETPEIPENIKNFTASTKKQPAPTLEIPEDLITKAPNLLGAFIRWTLETSRYPQPTLALAAAIPTIGNIMAHRCQTVTGLRSNFFTLGIAESGAGKDHARKCISRLADYTGMRDTLVGDPVSGTAVVNLVERANGAAFMRIDEFGRFLAAIADKNSASHTKMITTNMMHMYNNAGEIFVGMEYADNKTQGGRKDINQPCLNIYATTVPQRFYSALSNEEAYDGFLSRWLIFETSRFDVEPSNPEKLDKPPQDLSDTVRWWQNQPKSNAQFGIDPRRVPFSGNGEAQWLGYVRDCRHRMATSHDAIERAFYNRAAEHAAKLALVAHRGADITSEALEWAIEATNALIGITISKIQNNIVSSQYEADLKYVLNIVASHGKIKARDLARRTQKLDRRKRNDILDTLIESGQIAEIKEQPDGAGRPSLVLVHID